MLGIRRTPIATKFELSSTALLAPTLVFPPRCMNLDVSWDSPMLSMSGCIIWVVHQWKYENKRPRIWMYWRKHRTSLTGKVPTAWKWVSRSRTRGWSSIVIELKRQKLWLNYLLPARRYKLWSRLKWKSKLPQYFCLWAKLEKDRLIDALQVE